MPNVPESRVTDLNQRPLRGGAEYVLYWMVAARRVGWNFALQRAVECARELRLPLVVLEALRCDYTWASDRLHRFIIDGMADTARRLAGAPVYYYAFIETERGAGAGLLTELADGAALVVTDYFPAFFLPRMLEAAAARLPLRLEAVDGNGLLPLRAAGKSYTTAHSFRRFLHKNLLQHLDAAPEDDPLESADLPRLAADLPRRTLARWPNLAARLRRGWRPHLGRLPLDHDVSEAEFRGGASEAEVRLRSFLETRLSSYAENARHPDEQATSGLSPYLHFGHISSHRILAALAERGRWDADAVDGVRAGKRDGWWGLDRDAEAFLDQLVTWRELSFNMCVYKDNYARYESLPEWARRTLEEHANDERPHLYGLERLRAAETHDDLWNAAQTQLLREGRLHNYLRMLWGKKILEWSPTPRDALAVMIELNNRYALDGRDPNSYSGIFWCLGRYDRPFGPERPIYGKVRYLSSRNAVRKLRLSEYLEKYGVARNG